MKTVFLPEKSLKPKIRHTLSNNERTKDLQYHFDSAIANEFLAQRTVAAVERY